MPYVCPTAHFLPCTDDRHGDGEKAHDLSAEGKKHQKRKEDLDDEASAWIFNGTYEVSAVRGFLCCSGDSVGTALLAKLRGRPRRRIPLSSSPLKPENNRDSPPGTIDLHGLYVKEAIERTEAAIAEGQKTPHRDLRVIVGKGIHSPGHVAKIKPAVQDLMQKWVGICHKVLIAGTKSRRTLTRITLVC